MATARQTAETNQLIRLLERFEWDMAHTITREDRVPWEWQKVFRERSGKKRKVSLYLDEETYRVFKSMGAGMGPRMNTVLTAFVKARLAGLVGDEDLLEKYREDWMGKAKPGSSEVRAEVHRDMGWD